MGGTRSCYSIQVLLSGKHLQSISNLLHCRIVLKKCLAKLCQQIKNVKPQAEDFLGPQQFLTRQNLFV